MDVRDQRPVANAHARRCPWAFANARGGRILDDRKQLSATPDGAVVVVAARLGDLPELLAVQRSAFARVAREFGAPIESMPPAHETLAELIDLKERGTCFLVGLTECGDVVGTVRAELVGDTVEVGRLAVLDTHLRRGVGTALMRGLETVFPDARRFDLFTGADATGPIELYQRLGYRVYATERMDRWTMVRMAKASGQQLR